MLHNKAILTVEKCADAWYYIDTPRETKTKQKEETQMVFTAFLICAAVGLAAGLLTGAYESENEAMANK